MRFGVYHRILYVFPELLTQLVAGAPMCALRRSNTMSPESH